MSQCLARGLRQSCSITVLSFHQDTVTRKMMQAGILGYFLSFLSYLLWKERRKKKEKEERRKQRGNWEQPGTNAITIIVFSNELQNSKPSVLWAVRKNYYYHSFFSL